jgi:pimeloyl-ACP methyl ester carboxylesterase
VALHTADGARLVGDLYQPTDPADVGVVLVHGFSATRRHDSVVEHAHTLTEAGFTVLAYDGRGHGMSDGECTLGQQEALDVAAAVAVLRTQVPRIVTVGASMGALAVLTHAIGDPNLTGVVLVSIPTTWRSVLTPRGAAAAVLTRTGAGRAYVRRSTGVRVKADWERGTDATTLVGRLRIPVAVVHGRRDKMIRSTAATAVYRAAAEPRRLELVADLGHAFQPESVAAVVRSVEWAFDAATYPPSASDPPTPPR